MPADEVQLENALYLLSLPRSLGAHPNGSDVTLRIGRFGAYVHTPLPPTPAVAVERGVADGEAAGEAGDEKSAAASGEALVASVPRNMSMWNLTLGEAVWLLDRKQRRVPGRGGGRGWARRARPGRPGRGRRR